MLTNTSGSLEPHLILRNQTLLSSSDFCLIRFINYILLLFSLSRILEVENITFIFIKLLTVKYAHKLQLQGHQTLINSKIMKKRRI